MQLINLLFFLTISNAFLLSNFKNKLQKIHTNKILLLKNNIENLSNITKKIEIIHSVIFNDNITLIKSNNDKILHSVIFNDNLKTNNDNLKTNNDNLKTNNETIKTCNCNL